MSDALPSQSAVRRWRAVKVVQNMRMCQAASRIQQAWRHFCKRRAERLELIRQTEAAALLALQVRQSSWIAPLTLMQGFT